MEENQVESQNKKEILDPATAAVVGAGFWFIVKAVAQAIAGWLGLELFHKIRAWYQARKARSTVEGEQSNNGG